MKEICIYVVTATILIFIRVLQVLANLTYNAELLAQESTLFDRSGRFTIGEGFYGCVSEGQGVVFNSTSNDVFNVEWGCPISSDTCK